MASSAKPPLRYVPTLTEIVAEDGATLPPASQPGPLGVAAAPQSLVEWEEQLVQRVLIRLQQTLEHRLEYRLQEVVQQLAQQQARELAPALRAATEATVRELVAQAMVERRPTGRG